MSRRGQNHPWLNITAVECTPSVLSASIPAQRAQAHSQTRKSMLPSETKAFQLCPSYSVHLETEKEKVVNSDFAMKKLSIT